MVAGIAVDYEHAVLLLVDIQPDFMPGGPLAAPQGDRIVDPTRALMERELFGVVAATQDWHPSGHISFASSHGRTPMETIELYGHPQVLWPDHCVQGSEGACLHEGLDLARIDVIIRKGTDPKVDSYSGFRNNWDEQGRRPSTGLAGYLRERGVRQVFVAGLARDVCVQWTAGDAAAAGFETWVLWDLTAPVDPANDEAVREDLQRQGVGSVDSTRLTAA